MRRYRFLIAFCGVALLWSAVVWSFTPSPAQVAAKQAQEAAEDAARAQRLAIQRAANAVPPTQWPAFTRDNTDCDGTTKRPFVYGSEFTDIPYRGRCGVKFIIEGRSIELRFPGGHTTVFHDQSGRTTLLDPNASAVRSAGEPFNGYIVLYPQQANPN